MALDSEKYYRFPAGDASDEYITEYCRRHFAEYFTYRTRHLERIAKNIYYEIGNQWVERDLRQLVEGSRGFAFREMRHSSVELPRPVTNYITPAVDVEFATLSKRQWTPKIPTFSRDPRMEAAAKVANEILNDRLKRLRWEDVRDKFIRNLIVHGTQTIKSFWDESYQQTSWVVAEKPFVCTVCGGLLSSNMTNADTLQRLRSGKALETEDEMENNIALEECPRCGAPLREYGELDLARSRGTDMLGRALGEELPKGNTNVELITPFEYYPQNHGVGVSTETVTQHGICKIRSLDWVEDHFPDLIEKVEPEPPEVLLREHPILGEWDITERFDYALDAGIFDHHVRVYELYREPSKSDPKGRYIIMINRNQALMARNEELIAEVEDDEYGIAAVPKVMIASAIWKPREGEFWGRGLPDDLISPQNRVNGIDAQIIEARERMGSPNLLIPEDCSLEGPEYRTGYGAGKFFTYRLSALNPNAKPEVFGSILMPAGVNNERTQAEQDMTKIIGPADIEIGEAPRNITTTSGLQILGEQAERRRGTRERGITSVFKKLWEHQLQLLWVLRIDEDEYEKTNPDGTWEMMQYNRAHIKGHTKVEVEKQAYIDRSIVQREAAREAQMDQLYDISSPMARKKLLELRGLPTDVNEDTSLQIDHARRDWADFADGGKIPVVDKSIHNHMIRFQVFGTMLLQDEGQWITESTYWNQIMPALAGWEEELQRLAMLDAQVRQFYGGQPPPEVCAEKYAMAMKGWTEQQAQYDAMLEQRKTVMAQSAQLPEAGTAAQLPPLPPPPQKPPKPNFIPRQPEVRIMIVWDNMINAQGGLGQFIQQEAVGNLDQPEKLAARIKTYMKFRAVVEAHRLLAGPGAGPAPGSTPAPPGEPPVGPMPPQPGAANGGPPPTPGSPPEPPTPPAA